MQRIIYNRRKLYDSKRIIYIPREGKKKGKIKGGKKRKRERERIPKSSGNVRWQIIIGCVDEPKAKRFDGTDRIGRDRVW